MSNVVPGNTPFGQGLNHISKHTEILPAAVSPAPEIGRVIAAYKDENGIFQYRFKIRIEDSSEAKKYIVTPFLSLLDPLKGLSSTYGSPEKVVADGYMAEIHYQGISLGNGKLKLIADSSGSDPETVERYNEVSHQGNSFASPGAGSVLA